jgi:pentapeptide repeat protein
MKRKPTKQQVLWAIVLGLALAAAITLRFYLGIGRGNLLGYAPIAVVVILILIALSRIGYRYEWTGFGESVYRKPEDQEVMPKKTLWDWLQLFIVPVVLAVGGLWFTAAQEERQLDLEDKRAQKAQKLEDQRAQAAQELEDQRAQAERELEDERAEQAALQAYLDQIGSLLLNRELRTSAEDSNVRMLARARTLTTLDMLSPPRKERALEFLSEMSLIQADPPDQEPPPDHPPIISLRFADLHEVDLARRGLLKSADLDRVNLNRADLTDANLSNANLPKAHLFRADLSGTDLSNANLHKAFLIRSDLKGADLTDANLIGADLSNADLTGAEDITKEELEAQASSLQGATMPDGSKHP